MIFAFYEQHSVTILPYLPFVGMRETYPESDIPGFHLEQSEISDMINFDYMETLKTLLLNKHGKKVLIRKGVEILNEKNNKH